MYIIIIYKLFLSAHHFNLCEGGHEIWLLSCSYVFSCHRLSAPGCVTFILRASHSMYDLIEQR